MIQLKRRVMIFWHFVKNFGFICCLALFSLTGCRETPREYSLVGQGDKINIAETGIDISVLRDTNTTVFAITSGDRFRLDQTEKAALADVLGLLGFVRVESHTKWVCDGIAFTEDDKPAFRLGFFSNGFIKSGQNYFLVGEDVLKAINVLEAASQRHGASR